MVFMEALQHDLRKTAGWRPSATFWRTRRGANVRPLPFQALLIAQINPGLAVADPRPIG
jgi:hypothetical protein